MRVRRWLGVGVVGIYLGAVAYATAGTQCPVRPDSGCAKVHALMLTARPPSPMLAAPWVAPREQAVLPVAPMAADRTGRRPA